jgi:hypothetical protein
MNSTQLPFLRAIVYADIFDFPLTEKEVWQLAIGKCSRLDFEHFIEKPSVPVEKSSDYYFLSGRENIVQKRVQRVLANKKKLSLASKTATLLAKISSIRFIGVSGGVAMQNADKHDDIDLFIITDHNAVWTSRLMVFFLLTMRGIRRKRGHNRIRDTICANMYLDGDNLPFPKNRHDLYTAHEIVQVLSLTDKDGVYEKFLSANSWVLDIMPNAAEYVADRSNIRSVKESRFGLVLRTVLCSFALEKCAKIFQLLYMNSHRTTEVVSDTIVAFHPVDYRGRALQLYAEKMKDYE